MRVGSLFSGVGGFELGFARVGVETAFVSEVDDAANAVLAHWFPAVPNFGGVEGVNPYELPAFDVLTGGFPCQDVSVAGQRAGLTGERSGLFFEFARIVEARQPRWLLLENVPGLLSSNRGADFTKILGVLDDLGYGLAWRVLDAQFFGVPQRRRRVFVVGCLGGPERAAAVLLEREGGCWDPPARPEAGQGAAIPATCSTIQACGGERGYRVDAEAAAGGHLIPQGFALHGRGGGSTAVVEHGYGQWAESLVSGPLMERDAKDRPGQVGLCSELTVRRLTPCECERLQGFPDDWTDVPLRALKNGKLKRVSDSARYALMGNAVAVPVVTWIAKRLVSVETR